jgi:hypothetical protein
MSYKLLRAQSEQIRFFGLVSVLAIGSDNLAAHAQACDVKEVPSVAGQTIPATNENFASLSQCISDLSIKLEATTAALERANAALSDATNNAAAFGQGQGAVVAFNRSEREGACPIGWRKFDEAAGRFIVGAGVNSWVDVVGRPLTRHPSLKDKPEGAVGGEEVHQLTVVEMPSHDHSSSGFNLLVTRNGKEVAEHAVPQNIDINARKGKPIEPEGGDQPHNNMPPFVALYYCIKT